MFLQALRITRGFTVATRYNAHFRPACSVRTFAASSSDNNNDKNDPQTIVEVCRRKIQDALQATQVNVVGAYDDPNGSHISVTVVSEKFQGKRPVQRQQMVYKAIWEELKGPVHAVDSMVCKTPQET